MSVGASGSPAVANAQTDPASPWFATVAGGVVPDTGEDSAIAIAHFDLEAEQSITETFADAPGFLIAIDGRLLVSSDDAAVAVLNAGESRWFDAGSPLTIQSLDGPASFWRTIIGAEVNGRDLGGDDAYTFIYGTSGDASPGAVFPWVVKVALVPAGTSISLGSSDENVAYVLALTGAVDVDGKPIKAGEYISPFFGNPGVTTGSEPALVGYIARSAPVSTGE